MASIIDILTGREPSAAQSLAMAIPFLSLNKKQGAYYAPYQRTIASMADPSSAQYQRVYTQQRQMGQQNLAEAIAEMTRQNRKQAMLGRTPLFNPERGGEMRFRGLVQGYQDVQNTAARETQDILARLAQGQHITAQQQAQQAANKAGVKGNIAGAIAKLFGL